MAIRILIVAAYASGRAGLHALLSSSDGDGAGALIVSGEASGPAELGSVLDDARPDVVLLDENRPGEAARVLETLAATQGSAAGLVVLAAEAGADDFARLSSRLAAYASRGGWAYLSKEAEAGEITAAVRAAGAGLVALGNGLAPMLALAAASATMGENAPAGRTFGASGPATTGGPGETLTARETEVLQLMAQGLPNKIIASRLGISLHTAKFHVASILAKLGASSRTEAVTLGARRGDVAL